MKYTPTLPYSGVPCQYAPTAPASTLPQRKNKGKAAAHRLTVTEVAIRQSKQLKVGGRVGAGRAMGKRGGCNTGMTQDRYLLPVSLGTGRKFLRSGTGNNYLSCKGHVIYRTTTTTTTTTTLQ